MDHPIEVCVFTRIAYASHYFMPAIQLHFLANKNAQKVNCITALRRVALVSGPTVHSRYCVVESSTWRTGRGRFFIQSLIPMGIEFLIKRGYMQIF